MDTNKLLKQWGYGGRSDFGDIARWTVGRKFASEDAMKAAVEKQFGAEIVRKGLKAEPMPSKLFLSPDLPVDGDAIDQLHLALRLPVAVKGAGMPDLHKGYSLPIGGVVVLERAVSPAFVGYDISCMMMLTMLSKSCMPVELDEVHIRREFLDWMLKSTSFGLGSETKDADHEVMYDSRWKEIPFLRQHKALAQKQLGSSGSGNHFANIMVGTNVAQWHGSDKAGSTDSWVALMTHSGSRGIGNKAGHIYAELADKFTARKFQVPAGYGWMDIDTDLGREYLAVMEVLGKYAFANHEIVHNRFLKVSGMEIDYRTWNRHNYAWIDSDSGLVTHRKGATPADSDQEGIIPGSSGTNSYLVNGRGNSESLLSASHGAGRPYSRTKAKELHDQGSFERHMTEKGITYYGVAADETWKAYKDIDSVIKTQEEAGILNVLAIMEPKVVVMGGNMKSDDGD